MQDLGVLHHFLGIKVQQDLVEGKVWIGQPTYTLRLLERFNKQDSKPVNTPSDPGSKLVKKTAEMYLAAVGSLLYLSTKTRPDIAFAVGNVSRLCSEPSQLHWSAVKRILRYLKGSQDLGLLYHRQDTPLSCVGYSSNPVFLGHTKHVNLKYHFIRDQVEQGNIVLKYCPSEMMIADILTKLAPQFQKLRFLLGVMTP